MAAFALGLIGDAAAAPALLPALGDPDPRVQGRAAEALGLIGHAPAAGSIAGMAAAHVRGRCAGRRGQRRRDAIRWRRRSRRVRLGVYALVRLAAIDELRAVVIGADGAPVSDWWPLAYAMQRVGKPAAAADAARVARRAAARPRGRLRPAASAPLKDAESRAALEALVKDERQTTGVRVQAMRALARHRRSAFGAGARRRWSTRRSSSTLRLEAVAALGAVADPAAAEILVDYLEDEWAPMRAASQAALAKADPETFMTVLSGLDVDTDWSVRAALATTLGRARARRGGPAPRPARPRRRPEGARRGA